jgi:hypothetical protein
MPDADVIRFTVADGTPAGRVPDVRLLASCIPGAEVRDSEGPARVTGRLRLSAAGGEFSRAGTVTLHSHGAGAWRLRLEESPDGGSGGPVAEVTVGRRGSDGRASVTITPFGGHSPLSHSSRRLVEIVGRRVADQFFRNLAAAMTPAPTAVTSCAPPGAASWASGADPMPDRKCSDVVAQENRRPASARVAVLLLVIAGVAVGVRAVRRSRHV